MGGAGHVMLSGPPHERLCLETRPLAKERARRSLARRPKQAAFDAVDGGRRSQRAPQPLDARQGSQTEPSSPLKKHVLCLPGGSCRGRDGMRADVHVRAALDGTLP